MKFTITGSLGNISKPLAESLIKKGHTVTIISSNKSKAKQIEALGAVAAIGSVEDAAFLTETFKGADAVYLMVPPNHTVTDYRAYYNEIAQHYASAIQSSGVKKVVALSSIGAHLQSGTGPIAGLYDTEHILNKLDSVAVTSLRAGFFYTNFYNNTGMIKHAGIIGANYGVDTLLVMVNPADIADAAAEELIKPSAGKTIRYVASDEHTASEIAATLGKAIGKPDLPWVEFSNEQSLNGMIQSGLSENIARVYNEMGDAVRNAILWDDYLIQKPVLGKRKFEDFAKEFAKQYQQAS